MWLAEPDRTMAVSAQPTRPRRASAGKAAAKDAPEVVSGVTVTHPHRIWWPDDAITKGDVAHFYDRMAPHVLPWILGRPLVAERCPEGMLGTCFFQKNFAGRVPPEVPTHAVPAESTGRTVSYAVGGAPATLTTLVNLGCIAIHTMNCRVEALQQPDWLAFDLDPGADGDTAFADAAHAGLLLRRILDELGVRSYPKTSGARGLHVFVPLRPGPDQAAVRGAARRIAERMQAEDPGLATVESLKRARKGRVYVDVQRNAFGQTIVAPYSVRRRPGASVSTPLAWDEVKASLDPGRFNLRTIEKRLAGSDPWSDFWQDRQALPDV
jgi:bifunctional non-homologous end joining protein LigD